MTTTIRIRDLTSGDEHTIPASTRCRSSMDGSGKDDPYYQETTAGMLDVGDVSSVESDDPDDRDGHEGEHIWWPSERIG